jgi:hypothetical protein
MRLENMNCGLLRCCRSRLAALLMAALAVGLLAMTGCNHGPGRYALDGTVTLDGQPLEQGNIRFTPESGTGGPIAGGEISTGKFSIPAKGGTFSGRFRVEITATRQASHKVPSRMTGELAPAMEQYLPACYNTESTLRAEVSQTGDNRFVFAIKSNAEKSGKNPMKGTP